MVVVFCSLFGSEQTYWDLLFFLFFLFLQHTGYGVRNGWAGLFSDDIYVCWVMGSDMKKWLDCFYCL